MQRLYKKAASGSAALWMHLLCIVLQLSEPEVYPADGISASRLCRGTRPLGGEFENGWMPRKSHLTKRDNGFAETERGLS